MRPPGIGPIARVAGAAGTAVALLLGALLLGPAALGLERYVITGDSMSGTYDRGSIVFERVVPVADLRVGDVITYTPPHAASPDERVTHRIVDISVAPGDKRAFTTKGDANGV